MDFVGTFVSAFNFILKMEKAGSTENFYPSTIVHVVINQKTKWFCRRSSRINIPPSISFPFSFSLSEKTISVRIAAYFEPIRQCGV